MTKAKFWMCWIPRGGRPVRQHETLEDAKTEGERLSRKEGDNVAILECIGYVRPKEVPIDFVPAEVVKRMEP